MDPKTKDGVEDDLDLLHEPEPDKPADEAIEDEGEPAGGNFV